MKKGHTKYKKDELKLIVDNSVNYLQVIRTLGLSESGGAQQYIKKIIKILDHIDSELIQINNTQWVDCNQRLLINVII